jgi:hypothetical protein
MAAVTTSPAPARVALLHRTLPCCGGRCRFTTEADVYDRTCRSCGERWVVRRITLPASPFATRLGVRFDSLNWERVLTQ